MKYANVVSLGLLAVFVAIACNRSGTPTSESPPTGAAAVSRHGSGEHTAHGKGPNGGLIFDLGIYHAEIVVDRDKKEATVFMLTAEDNKPARVAAESLTLTTKETKSKDGKTIPRVTVMLLPQDKAGGTASKFAGAEPNLARVVNVEGTVAGLINGKPSLGEFTSVSSHREVPEAVSGTPAERELFLTPGGIYTAADIQANGNTLPSSKFRDISWPHDDDLKAGDKVCPVTANKADSRCNWIVNGRKYEFCCTPCLDKFVKWAKQDPNKIKEPDSYIQK